MPLFFHRLACVQICVILYEVMFISLSVKGFFVIVYFKLSVVRGIDTTPPEPYSTIIGIFVTTTIITASF